MPEFFSMDDADNALNLTPGSNGWHVGCCPNKGHLDKKPSFGMIADPATGKLRSYCQVCPDQKSVHLAAIDKIRKHVEANCGDKDQARIDSKGGDITIDIEQQRLDKEKFVQAIVDRASTYTPVVSHYLRDRKLSGEVPPSIRQIQLEYLPKSGRYYDTMLALVQDDKGKIVAIHRTYLESKPDGTVVKAAVDSPKKGIGTIKGNAVHLMYEGELIGDTLHLAEGIETGLGIKEPLKTAIVWAVLSAQNLLTVKIPATIKKLYIWADLDLSGTGEDWAEKAAKHFSSLGVQVFVLVPPGPIPDGQKGLDWLDMGPEAIVKAYDNATEFVVSEPWGHGTMPSGYTITKNGVFLEKVRADGTVQQIMVATGAIWLSGRKIDLTTRETELEISWYVPERSIVSRRWVNRGQLLRRATLLDMTEIEAFPSFDSIAGETAKFLALFERANKLPTTLITRKPGWAKNAANKWIYITGQDDQEDVEFHPEAAYRSYAAALKSKGTFANWLNAVRPLAIKYPVVLFAILASLAAPLLRLLDAANFVVDIWGPTSKGKTTLLQIIASVWGKPSSPGGFILSWNNTAIFSERLASFFGGGVPMFFDDSQTAQDKVIESIVYMVANGTGRGRAKPYSIKEVDSFQVIMFATGEKPLTERSYPGAKARVIEINGAPFPGIDPRVFSKLKSLVMQHYGFLGVQYISTLEQWKEQDLRDAHEIYLQKYMALATNEIGYRFATYYAIIRLAAKIVSTIPEMQWVEPLADGALDKVWHRTTVDMDETDMAQKALLGIAAWIESNRAHFVTSKRKSYQDPTYGIIKEKEGFVAILPHQFNKALMELGIQSPAAVLEEWKKRNLLLHASGRNQKQVNIDPGRPVWCICIPLSALYKQQEPEGAEPEVAKQEVATASQVLATSPSVITVTCQQGPCTDKAILDLFGNQPQDIIRYKKGILDSVDRKTGRITILDGDYGQNSWTSGMSANLKSKVNSIDDQSLKHLVDRRVHYKLGNGGDIDDIVIIQ